MEFKVENIKCGGCAKSITDKMDKIIGVTSCEVDIETGTVKIEGGAVNKTLILSELEKLGYPEKGTGGLVDKAKSMFSCVTGKMKD